MRTPGLFLLAVMVVAVPGHRARADSRTDAAKGRARQSYRVLVPDRVELVAGNPHEVSMSLVPEEGFASDRNGPLRIEMLVPESSGLALKKSALRRRDAIDPKSSSPRFQVELQAAAPGTYEI